MVISEIWEEAEPTQKALDSSLLHWAHLPKLESQEDTYNIFLTSFVLHQLPEDAQQMSSNNRKQIQPLWINYMVHVNSLIRCGQFLTHTLC